MNDYDECCCGDYRIQHKDGVGECLLCRWNPMNPDEPCKEFKLAEPAEHTEMAS